MKHKITGVLIVLLLFTFNSCNPMVYPSDTTVIYDYVVVDYNLIWLHTYTNRWHTGIFPTRAYYGIVDVPLDQYIACHYDQPGIGGETDPVVYAKDPESDPIMDFEIVSAQLFVAECNMTRRENEFAWHNICGSRHTGNQFRSARCRC